MEVGDQDIRKPKCVRRANEEAGPSGLRLQHPASIYLGRCRLERADRRGAHGHDPTALGTASVHTFDGLRAHLVELGVHLMPVQVFFHHRLERARAHVEQKRHDSYAHLAHPAQQARCEVQAGRGGRHRAWNSCVHRLILLAIPWDIIPANVRWQRYAPPALQDLLQIRGSFEAHDAPAIGKDLLDHGPQVLVFEGHRCAGSQSSTGARHRLPEIAVLPNQKQLDRAARARSIAFEARGDHARLVDHQAILRAQELRKVTELRVLDLPVGSPQHHQPGRVPFAHRVLSDQLIGEFVVVIGKTSRAQIKSQGRTRGRSSIQESGARIQESAETEAHRLAEIE